MADKETYIVEIDLDGKPIIKTLHDIERASDKTGAQVKQRIGGGFSIVEGAITSLKGAFLGLAAAIGSAQFLKSTIEAAIKQEEAINHLNTALRLTGNYTEQTSLNLQQFASDIQAVTIVGDEAAVELLALALNFTTSAEQAKLLTQVAIDLSAATGKDLTRSLETLGATLSGSIGLLGKVAPEVKNLSQEQLAAGQAIDILAAKFKGAGAAQAQSFGGAVVQTTNSIGDLVEAIGMLVTRSSSLTSTVKSVGATFADWTRSVNSLRIDLMGSESEKAQDKIDSLKESISKTEAKIAAFKRQISEAKDETHFFGLITSQASTAQDSARLKISRLEPTLVALKKRYEELTQAQDKTKKSSVNVIDTAAIKAAQSDFAIYAQKIVDQRIALELSLAQSLTNEADRTAAIEQLKSDRVRSINMAFETDLESLKKTAREKNLANTAQYFEAEAQLAAIQMGRLTALHNEEVRVVEEKNRQIVASVQNVLVSGVVNGMAQLGAAVATGQNAWESFGGSVLAILGDMMIQLGASIVAQSTALQALAAALANPFLAGGGIVAGLALIALGGALKGAGTSRGGVGAVAPPASPTGGILGPVAGTPVTGPDVESPGKGQAITINVEGTVLDPRSVGRQIAQILQETFESNEAMVSYA